MVDHSDRVWESRRLLAIAEAWWSMMPGSVEESQRVGRVRLYAALAELWDWEVKRLAYDLTIRDVLRRRYAEVRR